MEFCHVVQTVARSAAASRPTLLASQSPRCLASTSFQRAFSLSRPILSPPPPPAAEATTSPSGRSTSPLIRTTRTTFSQMKAQEEARRQQETAQRLTNEAAERLSSTLSAFEFNAPGPTRQRQEILPPRPGALRDPLAPRGAAGRRNPLSQTSKDITELINSAADTSLQGSGTDWEALADIFKTKKHVELRLRPSTGRTVSCAKGKVDVARAFALLARQVRKNRVAQDVQRQRFHERPGLKRKRLKGERWRKRFMHGFQAACQRVTELRRQGW